MITQAQRRCLEYVSAKRSTEGHRSDVVIRCFKSGWIAGRSKGEGEMRCSWVELTAEGRRMLDAAAPPGGTDR